ncbi:MAG: RNase adapter RapZ [Steroidobacteraceae bacterium]
MRLIFVSGLSGAGKSVALHALEDLGFYCVDNLPAAMLSPLISHTVRSKDRIYERTAIGIDARNTPQEIATIPEVIDGLKRSGIRSELLFLLAGDDELLRRYSETKRRHPLAGDGVALREAIALERRVLEPVINAADQVIDTSRMGVHDLRDLVARRFEQRARGRLSVTFVSFGFKHGLPGDADFVFDARTLPNPYWDMRLRPLTGRDPEVVAYLQAQPLAHRLLDDMAEFIERRAAEHVAANRRYLTIAVGCTGGQHRSVYLVDRLAERFADRFPGLIARHSTLRHTTVATPAAPAAP